MKRYYLILFILLIITGQSISQTNLKTEEYEASILFIGSSYLGYNNLTTKFQELAKADGKNLEIEESIKSGLKISQHLSYEETTRKLSSKKWDCVILQGSSAYLSKAKWFDLSKPYIEEFKKRVLANNSEALFIFMMPWAYLDGLAWMDGETDDWEQMQINLYHNTIAMASDLDITLAPAGWTWYKAMIKKPSIELYKADMNHPTHAGSYLTACVFYATIFQKSIKNLEYKDRFTRNEAAFFKEMASDIVLDHKSLWNLKSIVLSNPDKVINDQVGNINIFPNPTTSSSEITIHTSSSNHLTLSVYNSIGNKMLELNKTDLSNGENKFTIDGSHLKSGIYFIVLTTDNHRACRKWIIHK